MAKQHSICVLGGSGFVGRHLVTRLVRDGHRVKVLTRYRAGNREMWILPTLDMVEADIHEPEHLERAFEDCDTVINLVGILNEKGHDGRGFEQAHTRLPEQVARICRQTSVRRVLHMSALGADADNAPSHYQRTKGAGENAIKRELAEDIPWTIFRPSVIFGPGDSFINRFAGLLKLMPGLFPLASPRARFAPVYVDNVVEAFLRSLDDHDTFGKTYELCGPNVYTLKEIVRYAARASGHRRLIVGLPAPLSRLQATVMEYVPGKPFSLDNYRSTKVDNVCGNTLPGLPALGIHATPMEAVVPVYLGQKRSARARYAEFQRDFRRRKDSDDL